MVMGVGMSTYLRKYPSMSCTSARHIPQAFTLTRISSGWISGTGMSSRIGSLPYSCIRAAFISALLLCEWYLRFKSHSAVGRKPCASTRCIGRLCLVTKCSDSRLCNRNVLFNGAGTCADRTDDSSVQNDRHSAAEDDDVSRVAFLNAEERLSRLRESREIRGRFIEDSGCSSLVDGEVDAADERAVLAYEGH